jgi:hypothetical protein
MTNTASNPLLRRLAGATLITTVPLMFGGMMTAPPQDSDSQRDYIASLARDWDLSILSANLLHYYWVALALAIPAALTLLRGNRGRTLAGLGVAATMLGAIQMSGLLFADWFNAAMPSVVGLDQSVTIFERVSADPSMSVWLLSGIALGTVMPALVMAGLARNGVIGWWAVPVVLLPMVLGPMIGGFAGPVIGSLVGAVCCLPLALIGARLLRRTAADVTAAEQSTEPVLA